MSPAPAPAPARTAPSVSSRVVNIRRPECCCTGVAPSDPPPSLPPRKTPSSSVSAGTVGCPYLFGSRVRLAAPPCRRLLTQFRLPRDARRLFSLPLSAECGSSMANARGSRSEERFAPPPSFPSSPYHFGHPRCCRRPGHRTDDVAVPPPRRGHRVHRRPYGPVRRRRLRGLRRRRRFAQNVPRRVQGPRARARGRAVQGDPRLTPAKLTVDEPRFQTVFSI